MEYATIDDLAKWAETIMAREPDFVIGDNYLRRWWVIPRNEFCSVYLHEINASDDDRAFHDHPWENTSIVLAGSYIEHTPDGVFVRNAGDTVSRPADALHRLEIEPGERALTLFITGPVIREWGFACPQGWRHWRDFVDARDKGKIGSGCGE